jgi:DNA gyrase subunit A
MPFYDEDITQIISDDFLEYAGHVMQERAIPDARDALKDGARKILYIQYKDKNVHTKNFIKGAAAVGEILKMGFQHGDQSAYDTMVRMGKRFAVPYTLEELQGNGGNQVSTDNHASMRYLEVRQSELASYLFNGIDKNVIDEWYWNYADTAQLPRVLPTIGFYPLVNGFAGIAVGLSSSYPSTNLREVNEAIIKLIQNPDTDFEEIYCAPDFPMGGLILNGDEVKEAMKKGSGKSVKIRAKLEYDNKRNAIIATEIPFSVYTETIDNELIELINGEENPGIERYIDATNDEGAKIIIYLAKGANIRKIMSVLYNKTSLQSYYGINLIMLENGRFPRVFGWREALQNYITHIRACKRREYQYDLDKMYARKNIVEGLIKAAANIDDVVAIIRSSSNPQEAAENLTAKYSFNAEQTKAILAMKLSSLTRIDAIKLDKELEDLHRSITECEHILNTPTLLDEKLIEILREVAAKFGDERRTKIMNVVEEEEPKEEINEKSVIVSVLSDNTIKVTSNEIEGAKRGRKGKPLGLPKNVKVLDTIYTTNLSPLCAITKGGKVYSLSIASLNEDEYYSVYDLAGKGCEEIFKIVPQTNLDFSKYVVFFTKQGMIKKSLTTEYQPLSKKGTTGIKLREGDEVVGCGFAANDTDKVIIVSNSGYCVRYEIGNISSTGRNTMGVKALKLNKDEYVIGAEVEYGEGILSISTSGKGKITSLSEIPMSSRISRGIMVMKLEDGEGVATFLLAKPDDNGYNVVQDNKVVSIDKAEVQHSARNTMGSKLINVKNSEIRIFRK